MFPYCRAVMGYRSWLQFFWQLDCTCGKDKCCCLLQAVRFAICFLSSLSFKKNAHMKCPIYFRNNQDRRSTADFRPYFCFFFCGLFQFTIFFIRNRLAPLIRALNTWYFNSQMAEPAVRCCAMPVLYFCRNIDAVAWFHFNGFFSLFLIISTACYTD